MTFDAEKEIPQIFIWQAPCGCWKSKRPGRWPWFYKPRWEFYRWTPFWLGGDEFCRRTLVIGWEITGQIVIPLWYCRTSDPDWEICGCGPTNLDGVYGGNSERITEALKMHIEASQIMHDEVVKTYREWEKRDPLDSL